MIHPSKKLRNKPLYIIISLISIVLDSLFLYYAYNNFFKKNIAYFDSYVNFVHQNFFRSEFISGYKTFSQIFLAIFTYALITFSLETIIGVFCNNEKNKGENKKKESEDDNNKFITAIILFTGIIITKTLAKMLVSWLISSENKIQDFLLNSPVLTYLGMIGFSFIILGKILNLIDQSFELGMAEELKNRLKKG